MEANQFCAIFAGAVLDTEVTEGSVHSDVVCKKCFRLVNEFADLQNRVNEIKRELNTTYKRTTEYLESNADESSKPQGKYIISLFYTNLYRTLALYEKSCGSGMQFCS